MHEDDRKNTGEPYAQLPSAVPSHLRGTLGAAQAFEKTYGLEQVGGGSGTGGERPSPNSLPLADRMRQMQRQFEKHGHASLTTAKELDELLSQITPEIEALGRALGVIERLRKYGIWTA